MLRYNNIPITTRYDGKRVYLSTFYPSVSPSSTDLLIVSQEGNCLDTLAYKYYGDPTLYWIIANVNNIGRGRMSIQSGLILRIPTDINSVIDKFNTANS
jgi:hypothetical protein